MKIAIIHDWLVTMRGGENVLEALCEAFPTADIYTIYCQKDKLSKPIQNMKIIPSLIQQLPLAQVNFRWYLPLFPWAIEQFDLSSYDLVISTSHCVALGAKPGPHAEHICYCHSPMRYVWDFQEDYFGQLKSNWLTNIPMKLLINYLKDWELRSSARVKTFIANSNNIAAKIKKYYKRDSIVIYPPVDTDFFDLSPENVMGNYFLIVSSLVPYKKVEGAIKAFNQTGYPLKIVGDGPLERSLKTLAGKNIEFLGKVDKETLRKLYQGCQALIFNQEEDLGISALEAQACGSPVIAYARGGAIETVIDGVTGILYEEQTLDSLVSALDKFKKISFDSGTIRNNALKFNNKDKFRENIKNFIQKELNEALV